MHNYPPHVPIRSGKCLKKVVQGLKKLLWHLRPACVNIVSSKEGNQTLNLSYLLTCWL